MRSKYIDSGRTQIIVSKLHIATVKLHECNTSPRFFTIIDD